MTTPAVLVGFAAGLVSLIGIARWLAAGTTVGLRRFLLLVIPGTLALGSWAVAVAVWAA